MRIQELLLVNQAAPLHLWMVVSEPAPLAASDDDNSQDNAVKATSEYTRQDGGKTPAWHQGGLRSHPGFWEPVGEQKLQPLSNKLQQSAGQAEGDKLPAKLQERIKDLGADQH